MAGEQDDLMPGPVLIVIDLQRDYFAGGRFELPGIEKATANAATLVALFRVKGLPIVHVRHLERDASVGYLLEGGDGTAIDPRVAPVGDELLLSKHWPNAFRETRLAAMLGILRPDELVLCGAMSNMCVDATVKAAFDAGYRCTVIEDACAASDLAFRGMPVSAAQVHAVFMAALAGGFAEVLTSQAFVARTALS